MDREVGSLEMEREVGGRLGEGELDVLKIGNQGTPGFGRRREFVSVNAHMDHLAKEEEEEDMAWRSSMELDGHAGAGAKIIFDFSQDIARLISSWKWRLFNTLVSFEDVCIQLIQIVHSTSAIMRIV